MERFFLSRQVHMCLRAGDVVLMDLASGRYMSLTSAQAASLAPFIDGWPIQGDCGGDDRLLKSMQDKGLITQDRARGKPASLASATRPEATLIDVPRRGLLRYRARDVWRFLMATCRAMLTVRFHRLEARIHAIERRKAHAVPAPGTDSARIRELVARFERLRPLLFRSRDACLLHSLALLEFLARYRIYPDWVFAVKVRPFRAHCWLQADGLVLNDRHTAVSDMTPILVV